MNKVFGFLSPLFVNCDLCLCSIMCSCFYNLKLPILSEVTNNIHIPLAHVTPSLWFLLFATFDHNNFHKFLFFFFLKGTYFYQMLRFEKLQKENNNIRSINIKFWSFTCFFSLSSTFSFHKSNFFINSK